MGIGWGFLKQMNDTIKFNRELLGKKKSVLEVYKDEIKNRPRTTENVDIEQLRIRVRERLKRNRIVEIISRVIAVLFVALFIAGIFLMVKNVVFRSREVEKKYSNKADLFTTIIYKEAHGKLDLKTDYFFSGPMAAETFLKDGLKHQNSESYYESGEQFRSALYYYDSLVTEVYFFKNGDTISNFPSLSSTNVHHVELQDTKNQKEISFDFYDGKIIQGTYQESRLE
jgi:hypothetical protein